jgi:hypothetical protein
MARSLDVIETIDVPIDIDHPLTKIRKYNVLSPEECAYLIQEAERLSHEFGGWSSDRHPGAPTTDIPFEQFGGGTRSRFGLWKRAFTEKVIKPIIRRDYQAEFIGFNDLFLVKYDATRPGMQTHLRLHRDGTILTFVIQLNSDFQGGGTYIQSLNRSLLHNVGDLCVHCGWFLHGGDVVTGGERYVLVGFCDIEAPWFNPEHSIAVTGLQKIDNSKITDFERIHRALL